MKRTVKVSSECVWRKITRGVMYPFPSNRRRRVKYKEEIKATLEEIRPFLSHFKLVEGPAEVISELAGENSQEEEKAQEPTTKPKRVKAQVKTSPSEPEKETPTKPENTDEVDSTYEAIHINAGWYNVVSSTGKIMNEKKLRQDEADLLLASLNSNQNEE